MNTQLGFGFVGAGEIAVASAQGVQGSRHARLVRVYDANAGLAADLAATYGGTPAAALEEVLADPTVDAVYICVPHFLHKPIALQAATAGKHVFVEKPLGVSPDEAQAIVEGCRQAGVACGVPFLVRCAPAYREARKLVESGAIGEITGFRVTYRGDKPASYWTGGYSGRASGDWRQNKATAGGGVMIMNTIHDLDAILWIAGLDVAHVQGVVGNIASPGDVEDRAQALLECTNGALGSLEAHAALPGGKGPGDRWINRVYGRAGQIALPSPWGTDPLALYTRDRGEWQEVVPAPQPTARQVVFDEFAAAVLAGAPPPIPGEDGLKASRILHAVYESARRGERMTVLE
ncbi:MAG TPA: Gfo/Idh/MocA family oxidoreductase [Roseiflexaceae bacterium]|nr:Gfo/Idh/MocA family oxidoreductase [Roseiflexaceae bacterium]